MQSLWNRIVLTKLIVNTNLISKKKGVGHLPLMIISLNPLKSSDVTPIFSSISSS